MKLIQSFLIKCYFILLIAKSASLKSRQSVDSRNTIIWLPSRTDKMSNSLLWYSYNQNKRHLCLFMKQNCHFERVLAQYKHATLPLSFLGINTTLLGFPKRCITLVYLKRLKSYQPSKFKCLHFTLLLSKSNFSFALLLVTFELLDKVIYLFWKPWSVVLMLLELKGVA